MDPVCPFRFPSFGPLERTACVIGLALRITLRQTDNFAARKSIAGKIVKLPVIRGRL